MTMNIQRYEPRSLLNQWQKDIGRLFPDLLAITRQLGESDVESSQWAPLVDIKEEPDKFVVMADLPGIDPNNIEVTMDNQVLAIKGKKVVENQEQKDNYTRRERYEGHFYRQFTLPSSADGENIDAQCRNGVLEVIIPKKEQAKPRKIAVKASEEKKAKH